MSLLLSHSKVPLGFGGASISGEGGGYGFGDISEAEAQKLLEYSFERGIRIYDSAPIYGFGESEKRMGKTFKDKREEVFLISKCGVTWHPNMRVDMTNEPKTCQKMLEQSLRDFQSDYIDLYMVHWPDKKVDIRNTMEVLAKAKMDGKIKHIGLCNTFKDDLLKALEVDKVDVVQSEFNLFNKAAKEELFPVLKEKSIDFMSWGTFDKGIITGRAHKKRQFDKSDCRSWAPWWKKMDKDPKYDKMAKILPLLEKHNLSGADLAINYNLKNEGLNLVLCGAKSCEQVDGLFDSLDKSIGNEVYAEIEKILSEN